MKKFGVFFFAIILFVDVQSGFLDDWSENFGRKMEKFGEDLSRDLENQGRLIEQEAKAYAEQVERQARKKQEENQREQNDIMEKVKQIQEGTTPSGVNSANSSSLTENINGKIVTIKTTIYSTGNEKSGALHTVKVIYEGATEIDRSIDSIIWNGSQVIKKSIQFSPRSGQNNVVINNGGIVSTSGGTIITSTNGGRTIIQDLQL